MSAIHASRYISKPVSELDETLEGLKKAMENAKALSEYAKEQYARAEERLRGSGVGRSDFAIATEAYAFSVGRYCRATIELNRYLFDCAFPEEAKAFGVAA